VSDQDSSIKTKKIGSNKADNLAVSAVNAPLQEEMPFAVIQGKELTILPKDLYIPPDALEVILEAFEGPLDLLLYLIRRQNLRYLGY
jgi:segregation and condensation protein A